jgi:hypothetical protein
MRGTIEYRGRDLSELTDKIAELRRRRYATSESSFRKGVNSVTAPV